MPASSKRAARVKKRKELEKHTGVCKKAKRPKFDTAGETSAVAQDLGNKKKFTPHDICDFSPMGLNQEAFLRAFDDGTDLILMKAPAGCGKTFLALHSALSEVFEPSSPYDKVIVIRNTVGIRASGFLPGDLSDKNAPYEAPFIDACKKILPNYNDGYAHLKALGYLEFHSTEFLRGLNFERAIIILDEVQNLDYEEIFSAVTRCDDQTQFVMCGDLKQNDLARNREASGLKRLEVIMSKMPAHRSAIIEFTIDDVVRGNGMVKDFLIADYNTA